MPETNASIRALRKLVRDARFPVGEDLQRHVKELSGRNDRLLAVVCGSMIDLALTGLLRSVMYNGEGKLFDVNQPLSTFSAKIALAYSLDLIDNDIRRNADYIREVRNVFAHRLTPTYFRTPEVSAVCRLLVIGDLERKKSVAGNMRKRYVAAAIRTGKAISARTMQSYADLKERLESDDLPLPPASFS